MYNIVPNKKQKLQAEKYQLYLDERTAPIDKLSNRYNLFDDLDSKDKVMMDETQNFILAANKADVKAEQST